MSDLCNFVHSIFCLFTFGHICFLCSLRVWASEFLSDGTVSGGNFIYKSNYIIACEKARTKSICLVHQVLKRDRNRRRRIENRPTTGHYVPF